MLHLRSWVGEWPPPSEGIHVVGDPARSEPTWDGAIRPLQGVSEGVGTVIGVPPGAVEAVAERSVTISIGPGSATNSATSSASDPRRSAQVCSGRLTASTPDIADLGVWFEHQTDELPEWLAPFNGPRLVAFDDDGRLIAGVGIKVHDRYGRELSVVTDEAARGRGLARRLVATATRRSWPTAAVPTYLHAPDNAASARVAEEVGFADRGWTVLRPLAPPLIRRSRELVRVTSSRESVNLFTSWRCSDGDHSPPSLRVTSIGSKPRRTSRGPDRRASPMPPRRSRW